MRALIVLSLFVANVFADCIPQFNVVGGFYYSSEGERYRNSPLHLYEDHCRKIFRRASLSERNLSISDYEQTYWKTKDEVQELRDKIREEMIKLGFLVMDKSFTEIDVTQSSQIQSLLRRYNELVGNLKSMSKNLADRFSELKEKREAYIEQALIVDVKNEHFKMNVSNLRSHIIQEYLLKYDQEIIDLQDKIKNTTNPDELRKAIDYVIDRSLNDKRDPNKHYRHFLNILILQNQLDKIIFRQKGKNDSGTKVSNSGKEDRNKLRYAIRGKILDISAKELSSTWAIAEIYNVKNSKRYGQSKPMFADYDGRLLYIQTIANRYDEVTGHGFYFPENAKNEDQKERIENDFEIHKFTNEEREVLSKSKSLKDHPELTADISKWYRFNEESRSLYREKVPGTF